MKRLETEEHLKAETRLARIVSEKFDRNLLKLHGYNEERYRLDYLIGEGTRFRAIAEIKTSSRKHDDFPEFMISLLKFFYGVNYHFSGLNFVIIVGWTDCYGIYKYDPEHREKLSCGFNGNVRRGLDKDMEPVIYIPLELFKIYEYPEEVRESMEESNEIGQEILREVSEQD